METPRRWLVLLLPLALSISADAPAGDFSQQPRIDRQAERPAAQAGKADSFSTLGRFLILPLGAHTMEFEYQIDSEPNDRLQVYVRRNLVWQLGGRHLRGRVKLDIGGGPPFGVDFFYRKDGSLDGGLDTARVDNVMFRGPAGLIDVFRFDEPATGTPAGWGGGGPWGSWQISEPPRALSASRPPGHAFLGSGGGTTRSWMKRTMHWPSQDANFLHFDYFVDSEPDADYLRLVVDGNAVWQASGRNRADHVRVPVSQGGHVVQFEYVKNGSGDAGLDTARVDNIVARSAAAVIEAHDFAGYELDAAPGVPAAAMPDWESGGHGGGWVTSDVIPPRTYVPLQTAGQNLDTSWTQFVEPVVDGRIGGDYKNPTEVKLRNYGAAAGVGRLRLVASGSTPALFVGLRVPASTPGAGDEAGEVTLYLDGNRLASLEDRGCAGDRHAPDADDRRIHFTYAAASGASAAQVQGLTQEAGDCQGGFEALAARPVWPIEIAVGEPPVDSGFVHIELRIRPPAETGSFSDHRLGLGLVQENTAGATSLVRLPFRDDGAGPIESDVHSWETVNLFYTHADPELSEELMDAACCYPRPSRPGVHW